MAEFLHKHVMESGGDYTSLEACMNANEQDLTGDGWFTVEIDGAWTVADTALVTIHNYTTTVNDYINIYTTSTARHNGKAQAVSGLNSYRLRPDDDTHGHAINNSEAYVTINGLEITNWSGNWAIADGILSTGEYCVFKNNIIHDQATGHGTYNHIGINCITAGHTYIYSNIVYNIKGSGIIISDWLAWDVYGNTVYNYNINAGALYGISANVNNGTVTVNVKNNLVIAGAGGGNCYVYGTKVTAATNGGSDLTGEIDSLTATDLFESVVAGSEDLHLKEDADAIDVGTDLGDVDWAYDIDGRDRDAESDTWDIGADEYVVVVPPEPPTDPYPIYPYIAENIILPYTGTHAGIPATWARETALDGMFLLGCSQVDDSGGDTGGTATHSHFISAGHSHSLNSGGSVGAAKDNTGLAQSTRDGHTHVTANLSAVSPTIVAANNNPPYYSAIFCKADGLGDTIPSGFIVFSYNNVVSEGFTGFTISNGQGGSPDLRSQFIKGAATGADAGATGGAVNHLHSFQHNHTTPQTSGTSTPTQSTLGARGAGVAPAHTHGVTISNPATTNSSNTDVRPPYTILMPYYSTTNNYLQDGMIGIWLGLRSAIPTDWSEYTTLRNYFISCSDCLYDIMGDPPIYTDMGSTGGSTQHTHTSSHNHVGTTASIAGRETIAVLAGTTVIASYTHTHTWTVSSSDANFVQSTAGANYPSYTKVYFIKYQYTPRDTVLYDSKYYDAKLYGQ